MSQDFSGGLEQEEPQEEEPAKRKDDYKFKDHVRFGGNVGAQFGTYTFINLSPMVGYQFNDRFMMGFRGTYQYLSIQGFSQFSNHIFGASTFGRFFVFDNFFTHAEYEVLNGYFNTPTRVNIPFLYAGIGYIQPIGDRVGFSSTAMYELLRNRYSPYRGPIIRVGVVAGL